MIVAGLLVDAAPEAQRLGQDEDVTLGVAGHHDLGRRGAGSRRPPPICRLSRQTSPRTADSTHSSRLAKTTS